MSADSSAAQQPSELGGKSKGKQIEQGGDDLSMGEEESSGDESPVEEVPEEADEDNMEEIDSDNILGERTRGKVIDWAEADKKAKEAGDDVADEDDEDDDDEDFVDEDDQMKD